MPRILPADIEAQFDASMWDVPAVFEFIKKNGSIDSNEMYRVFNMGLGMVIVCAPENASRILKNVPNAILVGELKQKSSDNRVKIENKR
jgi:phosphoribosylformylglycinamidine cyclo-ligase